MKKKYLVFKTGVKKVIDILIIILFIILVFGFNPLSMYIFYLDERAPEIPFVLLIIISVLVLIRDLKIQIKIK